MGVPGRYPARPEAVVLSNFSLDVHAGEVLALVSLLTASVVPPGVAAERRALTGCARFEIAWRLRWVRQAEGRVPYVDLARVPRDAAPLVLRASAVC
jgi:hypothetical protein